VLRPPNLGCDLERDTGKLKKGKQQNQIQNTKEKRTTTNKDAFNLLPKYCTNWPLQGYPPEYVQERTLSGIEDGHIFYQDTIMVLLHNLFKSGLKSLNRTIKNVLGKKKRELKNNFQKYGSKNERFCTSTTNSRK